MGIITDADNKIVLRSNSLEQVVRTLESHGYEVTDSYATDDCLELTGYTRFAYVQLEIRGSYSYDIRIFLSPRYRTCIDNVRTNIGFVPNPVDSRLDLIKCQWAEVTESLVRDKLSELVSELSK